MSSQFKHYSLILFLSIYGLLACQPEQPTDKKTNTQEASTEHAHEEGPADIVELTDDQLRIGAVSLGKIAYRHVSQQLLVNGRLAVPAQSQVNISALLGGFIRTIPLLPGQRVSKGQVLARIENPELIQLQQDYAENHSRLTYLEAEFARQKELSEQNVSALKVFQQTRAELGATRARLTGLAHRMRLVGLSPEAALAGKFSSLYTISAPISGVVTNVSATAGQYVQGSDVIARLTGSQGLYAELTVFEKDLPQVREGQPVTIRLTNEGGRERLGRITLINRSIEPDRSVRVVAQLDQPDARLLPNTFLKASLAVGASRVTALPEEAIVSAGGNDYIFVVTDEKPHEQHPEHADHAPHPGETEPKAGTTFKQVPVRRGVTEGGYSQIILPASINLTTTQVVSKGAYAVLSQLQTAGGEEEGHAH
ncbi:efflux RND transporter periplasmic adaptor subunit [Spirosoma agri]|uniref:Efflux RND transporter periplasmic adaptor subunit n=1 Tax=Spirosoma agri TaxID=1987381 RepID=A0A6M0IGT0_9BACT|nr:efflux RND transporter periplasmic adaptor subunit [Spirosoma agri]NEU67490.1 efflux RND transporter periplasmic adaptor subunit [Spirosoma agri]